jgi:DNA mismatch repair protein MutS
MEQKEREETGIRTLKVGYNKVFGYYIEISKSFVDQVPEHYIRRQTLTNGERYITGELKELENRILGASEKLAHLEYDLFCNIRSMASEALEKIQKNASALAQADVLVALADVAEKNNYVRPTVDNSDVIDIKGGRHPVVEKMLRGDLFVPNDTYLDASSSRLMIVTGPNMAGKSTYMRQTALIALMAQMGSFVPAQSARIGVIDKIFTRVGASDDLASGQSTFMLEMSEVAGILKNATPRSLVIYDEIGRGTSTYDGMAIARAVLEYTANKNKLGAKCIFATHYHELTELEGKVDGVKNCRIAVKKRGDEIIFLRKIVAGAADESYGIEVAKLAGVEQEVIDCAKRVLKETIASAGKRPANEAEQAVEQLSLLDDNSAAIINELKRTNAETLSPLEALNMLYKLTRLSRGEE